MCASPRANHAIRTLPPSESVAYARMHDEAIWATLCDCLGGVGEEDASHAHGIASLPAALGCNQLSAQRRRRIGPPGRTPWCPCATGCLSGPTGTRSSWKQEGAMQRAQEAAEARQTLQGDGWTDCPTWRAVLEGQGAPAAGETSAGERPHGWQCHATRIQTKFYRDRVLMPALSPSAQALLRSQAGPQAGMWLTAIPAEAATTLPPQAMLVALRRRLRLALPLCPSRCGPNPGCGGTVDAFGDHALASRRAKIVERAWVRVAREAVGPEGQVVPQQWLAHTTAPSVQPQDRRRLDLVV